MSPAESNRFNRIPDDPYPGLFQRLLDDRTALERAYPYRISAAGDDSPFFFHFFRWRQTPEVIESFGQTWQPFGGSGYLVLLALLGLMVFLAALLCLAPALARGVRARLPAAGGFYFACLGAGFMFIEVSLLQQLTLPLERPAPAFAVVVSVLLLASGIGSRLSDRLQRPHSLLLACLTALSIGFLLPTLGPMSLEWAYGARLAGTVLLLTPLGILLGIPFPAGLRTFAAGNPARVGWVWSINGAVSGVAGVVGALVALDLGLQALLAFGALAYFSAWLVVRRSGWAPVPDRPGAAGS
jgi:hypothetical protein